MAFALDLEQSEHLREVLNLLLLSVNLGLHAIELVLHPFEHYLDLGILLD